MKLFPTLLLPLMLAANPALSRDYTPREVEISAAVTARLATVCDFVISGDLSVPRAKEYLRAVDLYVDKSEQEQERVAAYLTRQVLKGLDYECDFLLPKWYPE